MEIKIAGENSLIVYVDQQQSTEVNSSAIHWLKVACQLIEHHFNDVIIDLVPSYASLLIIYDIHQINHYQLRHQLLPLLSAINSESSTGGKTVRLPVYYDAKSTPDLALICQQSGLSKTEAIALHQSVQYQVYAIGFAPGFAFLGEVDSRLATPRFANPRAKVPKGAVAIADRQTAIYPEVSPGGWNLIGLCPVAMFEKNKQPPMPLAVGDQVEFYAIDKPTFLAMGGCDEL